LRSWATLDRVNLAGKRSVSTHESCNHRGIGGGGAMTHTRQNVWELGTVWADPILWYARGVGEMKSRSLAEPTSWRFYAAMHGIDPNLWQALGHLSPSEPAPSSAVIRQFWTQCQHGSWYFLPWHRGYLLALEANIRAAVVALGGPEEWALPYWNYFKTGQSGLPAEFNSPDWPDPGTNPLYEQQRYGPNSDSDVFVPLNEIDLLALGDPDFTGVAIGGSPGFGGVDTGFSHSGHVHGGIETQPHDWVHGLVGGADPNNPNLPGLMSDPDTAGLDPIFWLHHANLDRLWASWNQGPPVGPDPTDPTWLDGPASIGQRAFAMPMPDGTTWTYAPHDVLDIAGLDYMYDDLSPTGAPAVAAAQRPALAAAGRGGAAVPTGRNVELLGANDEAVTVRGPATSRVRLDPGMRRTVMAALARRVAASPDEGSDRVLLNLENVRGQSDASAFRVYVGIPDGDDVASHPELLAGSIAPFGMRKASRPDDEQAGQGLNFVFDITRIVDQLHTAGSFDVDDLPVRVVPVRDLPDEAQVSIGRISIFRQGR
jgi:tyrosinase